MNKEDLVELLFEMEDDYKTWQQAEADLIEARKWKEKMALKYANSAVKYYQYKNKNNETI